MKQALVKQTTEAIKQCAAKEDTKPTAKSGKAKLQQDGLELAAKTGSDIVDLDDEGSKGVYYCICVLST